MIRILLFMTLLSLTSVFAQDVALASCCEAAPATGVKDFGRCSGNEYCTACSNCSACKHCSKEGGSCGVCTTYEKPKTVKAKPKARAKTKSTPKAKAKPKYVDTTPLNTPIEEAAAKPKERTKPYKNHEMLEVTAENTTLRGGDDFTVIEKLQVGQMLTYISTSADGQWLEVRVDETGSTGFVFKQFVK